MNQRFKYAKDFVFNQADVTVLIHAQNNHLVKTFNFLGISGTSFYIIGVQYQPLIYDQGMGTIDKIYNYNDPKMSAQMAITALSSQDIHGDSVALDGGSQPWWKYKLCFSAGVNYDFYNNPILIRDPNLNINFDIFVKDDPVPAQLSFVANFILSVGTN